MNTKALTRATLIGLVLQIAMVVGGHYADKATQGWLFPVGGMGFSLVAGLIYARSAAGSWASSLAGGAIAGGVCALVGIAVAVWLKDVPTSLLMLGTLSSVVTGAIGGAVGKLLAR